MRKQPFAAYLDPELYSQARRNGMTNFSRVCQEAIQKYVNNSPIIIVPPRRRE